MNSDLFRNFVVRLKKDRGRSVQYLTQVLVKISSQLGILLTAEEINAIIKETFDSIDSE